MRSINSCRRKKQTKQAWMLVNLKANVYSDVTGPFFTVTSRITDDLLRATESVNLFPAKIGKFTWNWKLSIVNSISPFRWNKTRDLNPQPQISRHVSAIFQSSTILLSAIRQFNGISRLQRALWHFKPAETDNTTFTPFCTWFLLRNATCNDQTRSESNFPIYNPIISAPFIEARRVSFIVSCFKIGVFLCNICFYNHYKM